MKNGKSKNKSTSSLGALRASLSLWQDSEEDSPIPVEDSCSLTLKSLGVSAPDGLCGKMSPVFCPATEEGILEPSSGRWGTWGMGGPTGSWTLNGSEHTGIPLPSRSAGDVSSLSDVLETQPVQPKFFLSPKACKGILSRAAKRGKILPKILQSALEQEAGQDTEKTETPTSPSPTTSSK